MLKLVKALDLQHWADTKESEALMPELMRRLVHASLKEITYVSFPNEDNVYMPGFDGVLEVNQSNPYVSTSDGGQSLVTRILCRRTGYIL